MRAIAGSGEVSPGTLAEPVPESTRGRVLAALRSSAEPLTVRAVAGDVGLHVNTARFHLDALVARGLATSATEDRGTPGRPRRLYAAAERSHSMEEGQFSHQLLALILSSALLRHAPEPERAAHDGGEAWGRYLARRAPDVDVDRVAATGALLQTLGDLGFAPRSGADLEDGDAAVIELRRCAFREVADQHRAMACSAHLGLLRGILAELDAPLEVRDLQAEVAPGLCIAALVDRTTGDRPPTPHRGGPGGDGHVPEF